MFLCFCFFGLFCVKTLWHCFWGVLYKREMKWMFSVLQRWKLKAEKQPVLVGNSTNVKLSVLWHTNSEDLFLYLCRGDKYSIYCSNSILMYSVDVLFWGNSLTLSEGDTVILSAVTLLSNTYKPQLIATSSCSFSRHSGKCRESVI